MIDCRQNGRSIAAQGDRAYLYTKAATGDLFKSNNEIEKMREEGGSHSSVEASNGSLLVSCDSILERSSVSEHLDDVSRLQNLLEESDESEDDIDWVSGEAGYREGLEDRNYGLEGGFGPGSNSQKNSSSAVLDTFSEGSARIRFSDVETPFYSHQVDGRDLVGRKKVTTRSTFAASKSLCTMHVHRRGR